MPYRPTFVRGATALLVAGLLTACSQGGNESTVDITGTAPPSPAPEGAPQAPDSGEAEGGSEGPSGPPQVTETIASGLEAPWGLDFLPNGDAIVTERDSTRVLRISGPRNRVSELGTIGGAVADDGEGGLLGVAVSPRFQRDQMIYLYLTTPTDNRILRAPLRGNGLGRPEVIFQGIPSAFIHDGGRMEFGADGFLYVSTGDADVAERAQDRSSPSGKILRLTPEGDPAPGNPFDSPVWSLGHRNIQGIAFDDDDRLWASEFGSSEFDELNLIRPGDNYGWPRVEGVASGGEGRGLVDPQLTWTTDEASPSGLAYADGALWMAALQGERLWRITLDGNKATDKTPFFVGEYGRMRTIALAPDGSLWLTTSNRDGRGDPSAQDDRILRVEP